LAQFLADRRWLVDLCPPELLLAALVEDGEDMVVAGAAAAIFDPISEGRRARQIGKRRSPLSDARLKAAKGVALAQLRKSANENFARVASAVRNAVESRY